jgi:hypothetical protein
VEGDLPERAGSRLPIGSLRLGPGLPVGSHTRHVIIRFDLRNISLYSSQVVPLRVFSQKTTCLHRMLPKVSFPARI